MMHIRSPPRRANNGRAGSENDQGIPGKKLVDSMGFACRGKGFFFFFEKKRRGIS